MAVYGLVSSLWLRRVASIHKPGPARLLTCIPLIVCNSLTPLAFDHRNEVVAAACMFVSFVWLGTFKVGEPRKLTQVAALIYKAICLVC